MNNKLFRHYFLLNPPFFFMADTTTHLGTLTIFYFVLLLVLLLMSNTPTCNSLGFFSNNTTNNRSETLDRLIRDYAFDSFARHPRTAIVYRVVIPSNLSGVEADTVRYRSGSLRRYGDKLKGLVLPRGIIVRPYRRRVIVVWQNLGNWSSLYFTIPGFQIVTPVLGLLTYDASDLNATNPLEIQISATKQPITIDFTDISTVGTGNNALCASIDLGGGVSLANQTSMNVCATLGQGHFCLVIQESVTELGPSKASRWKVAVGSSVGGALGVVLLGLLCVALIKIKKRSRIAEMERRAYEEEALQMSMVGHVRAPTATVTRTLPTLENDYVPRG